MIIYTVYRFLIMVWHEQMKYEVTKTIIVDAFLYVPSILTLTVK